MHILALIIYVKDKDITAKSFCIPNGELRLLFATEAFSMGVDVPDVRRIIHIGPPATLECMCKLFYNNMQ
jgi:superfamily II DNA helicase RecQ